MTTAITRHLGSDVDIVAEALRDGYGDAVTTLRDRQVAADVIDALRDAGWVGPDEVWRLVRSAGGHVRIHDALAREDVGTLARIRDTHGVSYEARP